MNYKNLNITKKTILTLGAVLILPVILIAGKTGIRFISRAFAGDITVLSINQNPVVGQEFTMPINVNNPGTDPIASIEISASFDTSLLQMTNITLINPANTTLKMRLPITSGNLSTEQVIVNQANNTGKINFGLANFDPATQTVLAGEKNATLQVASITFKPIKSGTSQLTFNYTANNQETQISVIGSQVTAAITAATQLKNANITITNPVNSPTPQAPSSTPTITPALTKTPTPSKTPIPSSTPRPTPTTIPTNTPAPTLTPRPTIVSTPIPSPTPLPSPLGTLGNTASQPVTYDINNANILHAIKVTPAQTIQVRTGSIFIGNAQPQTKLGLAIYTDSNNKPGALIGSGNKTGITNGFNTITFSSPLTLNTNTSYWIATNNSGSNQNVNNIGYTYGLPSSTSCVYATNTTPYNSTFPTTFGPATSCSMYFMINLGSAITPTPTSTDLITFNDAPLGSLSATYPAGVTWQAGAFSVVSPWEKFTTRNLSLTKTSTQGTIYFDRSTSIISVAVYNGGNSTSTVTVTCGSQTKTQDVIAKANPVTIVTGFTGTCRTGTLRSTNGWDTNFDDLTIRQ